MTRERVRHAYPFTVFALFVVFFIAFGDDATAGARGSSQPLFLPAVTYDWSGGTPFALTIVDVNGDGRPDLLISGVGNNNDGVIGVLLGNSGGTFSGPIAYYDVGGQAATAPVVADVNGDGKPDVVVAGACSSNCAQGSTMAGVLLGNGDGTFQQAVVYNASGYAIAPSVAVQDLNGDGRPDLVVADLHCESTGFNGCLSVLLGNGDGTFRAASVYQSGGSNAESVVIADVNGDAKLDLLVTNGGSSESSVGVLLGNGDGSFQPTMAYGSGGAFAFSLVIADVNRDKKPDLVVTNVYSNTIGVLPGNGDGTFQPAVAYDSGGQGIVSLVVTDVNSDGTPDFVVANCGLVFCPGNGEVDVLLGNGDGTFRPAVSYDREGFPNPPEYLAVADVDGDGKPDVVLTRFFSGTVDVLLGNGNGSFQPALFYDSGVFRAGEVKVADISGDHKSDLVVIGLDAFGRGEVGVLLHSTADTTPPVITLSATPKVLWPPNGKMVPVTVSGTITDTGSGVNVDSAGYDVKDEYGEVQPHGAITLGPGGAYSFTILLQASRLGTDLDGRRYTVTVRAKDNAGNSASKATAVTVPHDQGL